MVHAREARKSTTCTLLRPILKKFFSIALNRLQSTTLACPLRLENQLKKMAKKETILIVDDDKAIRDSLERVLRLENFSVCLAANGTEAVREALRSQIDFVLLDLNLGPNESGWDTFDALHKLNASLPIFVMTGEAPRMAHASASHAAALLMKPISDYPFLFRRLRELSGQRKEALSLLHDN